MDSRTANAVVKLRRSSEFVDFVNYLELELDKTKNNLVHANPDRVSVLQGTAQVLSKILKEIEDSAEIAKTRK